MDFLLLFLVGAESSLTGDFLFTPPAPPVLPGLESEMCPTPLSSARMFSKTGGLAAKLYSELLELRGSLLTLQVSMSSLLSCTVESGRQSPSMLSEPDSTPELD